MENKTNQNESGYHVTNNNQDFEADFKKGNDLHKINGRTDTKAHKMKDADPLSVDNVPKNIPTTLVLDRDNENLDDFSSPDSEDLFSNKISNVNIKGVNVKTINRVNESKRDGKGNKRNSDNNSNISSETLVIRSSTNGNLDTLSQGKSPAPNDTGTHDNSQILNTSLNTSESLNSSDGFVTGRDNPSVNTSENLNQLPTNNLSDIIERVNTLNAKLSPKVVFHTPHTTPLKLKLNSLPVQSHPLDEHASNGEDFRNEPLDFPESPALSKSIDEICLKRHKRSPVCGHEDTSGEGKDFAKVVTNQDKDTKELKATELNCLKTPSTSFESVCLAQTPEFTNNVSAEDYLKKYDDINAQVRAYLNKTQTSDLDELNERTHRYLKTDAGRSISEELGASSKVTYVSDEEEHSQYDTIVSQDCHGVKLVKNPRKPVAKPASLPDGRKKLLLPSDLFSGNLLDDEVKSMSDEDLDELLSPSLGDEDLENSILDQLNISDDEIQELSAQEEREECRRWKIAMVNGVEKRIDMRVIEPYKRVLSHGGYLSEGCHNAIIVFSACFLPHHSRADYHYVMDNLFFYVLHTLDQLITEDYVLVYLHGATSRHNMPTFSWLKRCYQMIDRKLKKNLKQLYLVHATFWLKTIVVMSKPFISSKFSKKVQFIMSLNELQEKLPIEEASIPDKVRQYDKIKLSMSQSAQ